MPPTPASWSIWRRWSATSWSTATTSKKKRRGGGCPSPCPRAPPPPEPIPLSAKVIIIGSTLLYHLLYVLDDDFRKLFKIKADFDVDMKRSEGTWRPYARAIG